MSDKWDRPASRKRVLQLRGGQLVETFTGDGRKSGRMRSTFIGSEPIDVPTGILIDGAVYQLQGQPPVAQSHGWGYMGWIMSPFYRRTGISSSV